MSGDFVEGGVDVWRLYRGGKMSGDCMEGGEDVWRLYRGRGRCLETL